MNRRVATRVVDTGGAAQSVIINKDPCDVYWLNASPQAIATAGLIQIYDGLDTSGKLVFQCEAGYAHHHVFDPPIPCEQACFIYSDANMACWVLAYSSRKREEEQ